MKTDKKIIIITLSTFAVGLLLGWLIFGGTKNTTEEHHHHETEVAGETIWTCSMHPQIRQNEPGNCPICGMDLIPLKKENNEGDIDPSAVSMSPSAIQLASISTTIVGAEAAAKAIRLNGKIQADERFVYSQSSHIPGRIENLKINFTGEYVNKGQTIASVYSPDLVTAQEELFEAQKIKDIEPQLFNSVKEKLKNWKLSDQQINQILKSGASTDTFNIRADVSGYVTKKAVNPGDYISRGQTIYEISDLSKVWVLFDIYESDMQWVKKGNKVTFNVASLPGESFTGTISFIDPIIDPKTRVAKARVEVSNQGFKLKPEMFVSGIVEANLANQSNSIVVPKTAVMWTGKRSVVYVKNNTDKGVNFVMRTVTLGPALGERFVIEDGLKEGEEIAVNGTFSIDAAAQLAGKPSMMNPEGGQINTGHHHHGGMNMSNNETAEIGKALSIDKSAENALKPLYTAYLKWKNELTNDNFQAAQKAAVNMKSELDKIDMKVFKGEAHKAWMGYLGKLNNNLEHVHHFSNIDQLRKTFQSTSSIMIDMTNTFSNPLDKTIYIQHCPMADSNNGAEWLSSEKEIKNPYFGNAMPTCGDVTKEIK